MRDAAILAGSPHEGEETTVDPLARLVGTKLNAALGQ